MIVVGLLKAAASSNGFAMQQGGDINLYVSQAHAAAIVFSSHCAAAIVSGRLEPGLHT